MRLARTGIAVLVGTLVTWPALAAAQEPVRDFTQLNTRLKPGDTVYVTDARGREVNGRITNLTSGSLALNAKGAPTLSANEVSTIQLRERDSLRRGALIGLGVGAVIGIGLCVAANAEDPHSVRASEYAWCPAIPGAIGAGIGVGIDAITPGRKILVYRAPGSTGAAQARLSFAPFITRRARGVGVSFTF